MTVELTRRLLALGVPPPEIEAALFLSVARGVALPRALIDRGVLTERALEEDLARAQGFAMQQVSASPELALRLPPSMCRRLGAVPVRYDAMTNAAEIAAIDALDPHVAGEFSFHLGLDVRVVRATMAAIEAAIRRLELGDGEGAAARVRRRTPAFPHGAPRSTAPPPPLEDIPIPLVKRVGGPLVDRDALANAKPPSNRVRAPERSEESPNQARAPERNERRAPTPTGLPRLLDTSVTEVGPPVSFPSAPPARALEVYTAVVPPPPSLPPDTMIPSTEAANWGPASETFQAGFAQLPEPEPEPEPELDEDLPPLPPNLPPRTPSNRSSGSHRAARTKTDPMELAPPSAAAETLQSDALEAARADADVDGETTVYQRLSPDEMLESALDRLSAVETRDELIQTLVECASEIAVRVGVFVFKKDGYHGWACNPEFGDRAALRTVTIPHSVPNILATATAAGFYLGPVPSTPGHTGLLAVMGPAGSEVAVHVGRVSGKPALLLIAERFEDSMRVTRALGEMMRVAGLSLGRILALR